MDEFDELIERGSLGSPAAQWIIRNSQKLLKRMRAREAAEEREDDERKSGD
jgi:hypothetical protein